MAKIVWGDSSNLTKYYQRGIDRGVVYDSLNNGTAWNGLLSITEKESAGELSPSYFDGVKNNDGKTPGEFSAVLRGYSPPLTVVEAAGVKHLGSGLTLSNQPSTPIGLSYRTLIGDVNGESSAYQIHIIYNATLTLNPKTLDTVGASTSPAVHEWAVSAVPLIVEGRLSTAHICFDTRYMSAPNLASVEDILYGTVSTSPTLKTLSFWMNLLGVS